MLFFKLSAALGFLSFKRRALQLSLAALACTSIHSTVFANSAFLPRLTGPAMTFKSLVNVLADTNLPLEISEGGCWSLVSEHQMRLSRATVSPSSVDGCNSLRDLSLAELKIKDKGGKHSSFIISQTKGRYYLLKERSRGFAPVKAFAAGAITLRGIAAAATLALTGSIEAATFGATLSFTYLPYVIKKVQEHDTRPLELMENMMSLEGGEVENDAPSILEVSGVVKVPGDLVLNNQEDSVLKTLTQMFKEKYPEALQMLLRTSFSFDGETQKFRTSFTFSPISISRSFDYPTSEERRGKRLRRRLRESLERFLDDLEDVFIPRPEPVLEPVRIPVPTRFPALGVYG